MFGFINEVALVNVQSHKRSLFRFKETGLHRIAAEGTSNSYGKSVLRKALIAVFTPTGKDLAGRKILINKEGQDCYIIVSSTSGMVVTLYLHIEEKYCYYELEFEDQVVRKYLRDDYRIILEILGFHYLADEDYSLNFYKTKTTLPFTHFRPRLNNKILDSASELPNYRLIMDDIESNLSSMARDMQIADNMKGSYEFHLTSLAHENLEDLMIEEKLVDVWLNYLEPLEESRPVLTDLRNSIVDLENVKYIDTGKTVGYVTALGYLSDAIIPLTNINSLSEQISSLAHLNLASADVLIPQVSNISDSVELLNQLKANNESLVTLEGKLLPRELDSIYNKIQLSGKAYLEVLNLIEQKRQLSSLTVMKTPDKIFKELNNVSDSIINLTSLIQITENLKACEEPVKLISKLEGVHEALDSISEFIKSIEQLNEIKIELMKADEHLNTINNDISSLSELLEVCPTCGQLITNEKVGHEHDTNK